MFCRLLREPLDLNLHMDSVLTRAQKAFKFGLGSKLDLFCLFNIHFATNDKRSRQIGPQVAVFPAQNKTSNFDSVDGEQTSCTVHLDQR